MTVLIDTRVMPWSSAAPLRLSPAARLAQHDRITISVPVRTWLDRPGRDLRTIGLTSSIAATAALLPTTLPRHPVDRAIDATGVEQGLRVVTKNREMRRHGHPTPITVW